MKLRFSKPLQGLIVILGVAAFMGWMDWKFFFPLSSHDDFRFQLIGEFVEWIVVYAIVGMSFLGGQRHRANSSNVIDARTASTMGIALAILNLAMSWRSFFPGDHYQFSAGVKDLAGAIAMGTLFGLFSIGASPKKAKPSPSEEKSAV